MIMAFAGKVAATDAVKAELQALLEGIDTCQKMGLKYIIIEGNCLMLISSLKTYGNLSWQFMVACKKFMQAHLFLLVGSLLL